MLECLIHTTDTFYRDPAKKDYDKSIDLVSNMKQGYLQSVRPGGSKWGKLELDPKRFLIVQIEDHWFNPAWLELDYDKDGNEICDRRLRFPLEKILSLGEFESLKSITYNSTEKLSPIIKYVDLKTIVEVNDIEVQPDIIKLHGSAGDFSIQEDGGGDYTSLKTAVETEAADISGGAVDANFYITEAWTNPDTGNWDIDGWTMGSNNMLIQTQGDSRSTDGIFRSDGHRISDATQGFDIEAANVTVDGIQIAITGTGRCIDLSSGATANSKIANSILDGGASAGGGVSYASGLPSSTHTIENTIIYRAKAVETASEGVLTNDADTTVDLVNCTVSGWNDGLEDVAGTINALNCDVFNNDDDFDAISGTIDYCASDDGDGTNATTITQSASDYAALVVDMPNGDFTPTDASSELVDNGTATGRPATDITGATWVTDDIGAIAFISGKSATLTGTAITGGVTESEIVDGNETIIITLTGDTWVATVGDDSTPTDDLIAGITSAQVESTGWNAEVRDNMVFGDVTRTSDIIVTIILAAEADYSITANETITITIPATALTAASEIVATPTFEVTNEGAGFNAAWAGGANTLMQPGVAA